MSKTKIWCCTKNNCVKKTFDVAQKIIWCIKLMLHEKLFYVNKKMLILHKKSISCRQKQDDDAQKNILCLKKLLIFSITARLTVQMYKGLSKKD